VAVAVEGLAQLSRAFARAEDDLRQDLKAELLIAGIPVKDAAEELAHSSIPGIGRPRPQSWGNMRLGASRHVVYLAPKKRQTRVASRKRPKFGPLLHDRAMVPALDRNVSQVIARVEFFLGTVARDWGKGG